MELTSTQWLLSALLTLLAAVGISYFLRVGNGPGATESTVDGAATSEAPGNDPGAHYDQATGPLKNGLPAEVEVDRRLPPLQNQCLTCSKKSEELGKPLLRCSQCKNAFYCSELCQKKEWKRHKFNCSLFPAEGLKPAVIPITKELVTEIQRVDLILKTWLDKFSELTNGLKEHVDKVNAADLPEAVPICQLKLSPEFEYKNLPQQQLERHPFRNSLIQISRLYLTALIASHPNPEHRKLLSDKIGTIPLPPHLAPLYGPKIVSRPADLSPGEYDTFAEIAPTVMMEPEKVGMDENERGRWIGLAVGLRKLWNAALVPRPPAAAASS
ncbi:hypothetical protein P691DRAFT_809871 [Macrolepiota fuliginosa MF-IS2]|uniref:MYND-type domain-containing protein n=1 Tax=Macrolepiota fuliginosa MF-IS2 TaxID=1400762 RepID=A0A9P5XPS8_9AGAR|nr:hypothetical protein P691DRAFT_809871 [Macrolepiota fuliginosa MF-IS2]